jgi:hypothetical protein
MKTYVVRQNISGYHLYKYSAIVGKQMPTGVDKAILNSFSFTSVMIERNCRIN